jgi:NTE family protein
LELGLCLSGGGYRAMLFHGGALARLNEIGWLKKLDAISSVSGGSIAAGLLGAVWNEFTWDQNDTATNFDTVYLQPLLKFSRRRLIYRPSRAAFRTLDNDINAGGEEVSCAVPIRREPAQPARTPALYFLCQQSDDRFSFPL